MSIIPYLVEKWKKLFDILWFFAAGELFQQRLSIIIEEFNRIGIIHTDFDLTNIGHINGKLYIFDYGTSLCPISNRVGIRNSERYNHLEAMPNEAKDLVHNPMFYYDDLMHLLHEKNNACMNYIVSNDKYACAKFGQKLINYKLVSRAEGSNVKLLNRI